MVGNERMRLRQGSEDDMDILVTMSQQRSEEQHSIDNNGIERLKVRMRDQMRSDFAIFLFEVQGRVIGYSLVSRKADPLSILEYFLLPEERGKGYGYEAITKLLDVTNSTSIDVSTNAWREAAGAM